MKTRFFFFSSFQHVADGIIKCSDITGHDLYPDENQLLICSTFDENKLFFFSSFKNFDVGVIKYSDITGHDLYSDVPFCSSRIHCLVI